LRTPSLLSRNQNSSPDQKQPRGAMAPRSTAKSWSPDTSHHPSAWTDPSGHPSWSHEQDEAASAHAKRLLARSGRGAPFHRLIDAFNALRDRILGHRWIVRSLAALLVLSTVSFVGAAALWWRLGEGPISLDFATPWLAGAIEDNLGSNHSVEVGGTQIERAGRVRFAVRVLNIVVRDRDKAIVASAPKAEVRLSMLSLLIGRLRAESLSLVDAELFVQIQPDGRIIVSTGNNARPIVSAAPQELALAKSFPSGAAPAPSQPIQAPGQALPIAPQVTASTGTARAPGDGLRAALAWLDRIGEGGLAGYDFSEVGLKNGNLVVDDQQSGRKITFRNITLGVRRLSGGGLSLRIGEEEPADRKSVV